MSREPEDETDAIVEFEITDFIDLHTFSPREVADVVESYLEAARDKGFREVRLIHGRGIGVQRARVQSRLRRLPYVAGFCDAPAYLGGWGATCVTLLPPENEGSG